MFSCGLCFGVAIATSIYLICMQITFAIKEVCKQKIPKCTCKGCPKYDEEFGCICSDKR